MTGLLRDVQYALRTLRRSVGFTLVTLLTLAIGIGATTSVISVADHALLRPLPFPASERLFTMLESNGDNAFRLASFPTFTDWADQSTSFADISFVRGRGGLLRSESGTERVTIGYVTPGFFATMTARPLLGRTFGIDEERDDAGSSVVLSYDFWQRHFAGDQSVLGRTLTFADGVVTVIGVMPAGTTFPAWCDVWRPIAAIRSTDPGLSQRNVRSDSRVIARLKPGVSVDAASTEMNAIARRIASTYDNEGTQWTRVQLTPLRNDVIGNVAPMLLALSAAVVLALIIACVNVANLSLVRATAREREMAIRAALGAGRRRIVRQLIAESLVIATAAGACGVLLTQIALRALRAAAPAALPRASELTVDARVLGCALLISLVVAALCGLAPALHMLRIDLASVLRGGRAGGTQGPRGRRIQSALTVAQFGLALMLLIGATLLIQSFRKVQDVDVGFTPHGVLALRILPPSPRYDDAAAVAALYQRILDAARAVPGVHSAAIVNHVPLSGASIPTQIRVPGRAVDSTGADAALYKSVSIDYLDVMRIPLLQGRWFTSADFTSAATGVVISDLVAKRYWPKGSPIGQTITIFKSSQARPDFGAPVHAQVIGVVGDVRHFGMEANPTPDVYVPYTSEPWPHAVLVVRTEKPMEAMIPSIQRAVLSIDRDLPVTGSALGAGVQPLERYLGSLLASRRWIMSLVTSFAFSALLLAAIGIYGVTSYGVAQRTHEIGVRVALGATRAHVIALVLKRGIALAGTGVIIGVAGAVALTRLIAGLLFETSPTAPSVFVLVSVALSAVATIACYVPARRAARVDPVIAFRAE